MFHERMLTAERPYAVADTLLNASYPSHWHREIEIIHCLEGAFTLNLDNRHFDIQPGKTVFIGSAEAHMHADPSPGTRFLLVKIGEFLLGKEFSLLSKLSFDSPVLEKTPAKLKNLFDRILAESEQPDSDEGSVVLKACLFELTVFILREIPTRKDTSAQKIKRFNAMERISAVLQYINANYDKEITVDEAARQAGYKTSSFFEQFKMATQMTFHQYLNTYRISRACALLNGGEPITIVAQKTGFPELKTFNRLFKKQMNMTPTEYKKLNHTL